jgi:electron transfer flavoprotein beta subunit
LTGNSDVVPSALFSGPDRLLALPESLFMNIAVCIKRVPDTATRIEIAADGRSIERSNIEYITSPYDEYAVEQALRLSEEHDGEVTVLTLGPEEATKNLRECLAKGCHQALRIPNDDAGDDPFAIASALVAALEEISPEIVLFGYKASDCDNAQVGSMVGTLMDIAVITEVSSLEIDGERVRATREAEGGHELVEADLPVCLTIQKGAYEPRIAGIKGIMAAKKKPLEETDGELGEGTMETTSLSFPPRRQTCRMLEDVGQLTAYLKDELKLL